jgi:hypothetical protein
LFPDAIEGAHQPASGTAGTAPAFYHLALHMDRVAREGRRFHVEFHVEKGETGVLHCGVHQQSLGEGIHHCGRNDAVRDIAFGAEEFGVGEQHFGHAGHADEGDQIGFS